MSEQLKDVFLRLKQRFCRCVPAPIVDFSYADICAGEMVMLQGVNLSPQLSIDRWVWTLGDGRTDSSGINISPVYTDIGTYQVNLRAKGIKWLPVKRSDTRHRGFTNQRLCRKRYDRCHGTNHSSSMAPEVIFTAGLRLLG